MAIITLTDENLKNLHLLLEYLSDSEKKHYEEYISTEYAELIVENIDNYNIFFSKDFYEKPEIEHIYAITQRVIDNIDSN